MPGADVQIGRWTVTADLGSGRLGPLSLVRSGDELACARRLDAGSVARPGVREALIATGRGMGGVRHPGVIPLLDIVDAGGATYVITAYAPGPGLRALLSPSQEVPGWAPDGVSAVLVLGDVADAILGLHAARMAHGAIAASSVIVGYDGVARIGDPSLLAIMTGTPLDPEADRRAWADLAHTVGHSWVRDGDPAAEDIARAAEAAAPADGRRGDLAGAAAQLARRSSGSQADAARSALRAAAGEWAAQRAVAPPAAAATPEGTATLLDFGDIAAAPAPAVAAAGVSPAGGASSPAPGGLVPPVVTAGSVFAPPSPPMPTPAGTPTVFDGWTPGPPVIGTPTVHDTGSDGTTWRDARPAGTPPPASTPTSIGAPVGTPTVIDRFPGADTPYRLGVAAPAPPAGQPASQFTRPGLADPPPVPGAYPGAPSGSMPPATAGPAWFSAPPPPRRGRGGLLWLLVGALAFVAVAGVGGYLLVSRSSSGPALSVTGIVAVAQPAKAGCDSDVHVSGTITTNGGKGTIDYQWFRDGQPVSADILHMPVDKDQTQVHLPDLTLTNTGKGSLVARVTLTVISPAGSVPGTTSFSYSC